MDDDIRALRDALANMWCAPKWSASSGHVHIGGTEDWRDIDLNCNAASNRIVGKVLARYIAAASPDRVQRLLDEVERLRAERGLTRS